MENNELLKEARKMYLDALESAIEEFKNELQDKPYLRAENLYDMTNDKIHINGYEEVMDTEEYKSFAVQNFVREARKLNIKLSKESFIELIKYSPEALRGIDFVDRGASKILADLIKEDSKYIKYVTDDLTGEKLLRVAKEYQKEQEWVKEKYSDKEDNIIKNEEDEFYYNGDPNFIIQLIKTNPEILQETTMKYILPRNPDIKLSSLLYQREQLKDEDSKINEEISLLSDGREEKD